MALWSTSRGFILIATALASAAACTLGWDETGACACPVGQVRHRWDSGICDSGSCCEQEAAVMEYTDDDVNVVNVVNGTSCSACGAPTNMCKKHGDLKASSTIAPDSSMTCSKLSSWLLGKVRQATRAPDPLFTNAGSTYEGKKEWFEVTAADVKITWRDPPSTEIKSLSEHLTAFGPACCGGTSQTRFAADAWSASVIYLAALWSVVVLCGIFGLKKKGLCCKKPPTPVAVTAIPAINNMTELSPQEIRV